MNPAQHKPVVENPNTEVIAGLREAADWLEAHPELYAVRGLVSFYPWGEESRPILTTLARALGERATERVEKGYVYIEGWFGTRVRVMGSARVDDLGGVPVAPVYQPILKACPECRGAGGEVGFSVRTGLPDPQSDSVCERCEGSGRETF